MPTLGLKELEVLRLQDTDSLKKFPSIYNFEVSFHGFFFFFLWGRLNPA
jgi:hypothetical protein